MKIFAERLKELRIQFELSAGELGKIIGVSDTSVCNWENNKHDIKGEQLIALAKYFNVTTDFLLGLEEA